MTTKKDASQINNRTTHTNTPQRSGRSIALREVYRLALQQFPTAVKLWREWLEHELRLGK